MWSTPARLFAVLDGTLKAFDAMRAQVLPCVFIRDGLNA